MTTNDPLAPFRWLNVPESEGGGRLDVIFSVAFFRGLDPAGVVRRFSRDEDAGRESDFAELLAKACAFASGSGGGDGGGHVGVLPVGEWCVVIEPAGWMVTLHQVLPRLSAGCEVLAITRHDYAEHGFEYAIDGTIVTGYPPWQPYERHGSEPDRLDGFMRELDLGLETPAAAKAAWDADWEAGYDTAVARAFALAAKVTGVPFTEDLLDRPMLVAPFVRPLSGADG
ncbi:hypothetical protein HII36_29375 [Nonomuraea sp. NN258]|uniref:DUF6461 domain-containing protein n=1 Tax=Nonomuraea antri TaxID=2730852 RepID=UPI00156952EA|nr:DUF6461 domain-containing protein [Nonomuraea antri]NRQ35915.1 hypothetical protein [Nonomuraea antri]